MSFRRALPAILVLLSACAGSTAALSEAPTDSQPPASASVGPATASPSPTPDPDAALNARTIASLSLEGGPDLLTEAFGSLWVFAPDSTEPGVYRIDPATNEVVATVRVGGRPCQSMGASPEAIWVCGPEGLSRIDPVSNEVVAAVPFIVPTVVSRLAYGAGSVWSFASSDRSRADMVVRIDTATNVVTAQIPLGHVGGSMAFGFDALWVTSPQDDLLLRIDAATGEVAEWSVGVEGGRWVAVDDTSLWVSLHGVDGAEPDPSGPTLVRIDPADGSVVAEIATGGSLGTVGSVYPAADAVWVRTAAPFLVRIDPATYEVVDRIDANKGGGDVTVAFGSVWAASYDFNRIWRLEPTP